jgi:hypothetical protein
MQELPRAEARSTPEAFQELLDRWQVFALLSPPRLPRYNGSVEAGNGSVKTRVRQEAARHDGNNIVTVSAVT